MTPANQSALTVAKGEAAPLDEEISVEAMRVSLEQMSREVARRAEAAAVGVIFIRDGQLIERSATGVERMLEPLADSKS